MATNTPEAARRAAQELMHASLRYRYAYPDPDVDAPKAPELHPEVTKLITVERPQEPSDVPTVELTPPFSTELEAARHAAAIAQPTVAHP